MNKSLKYILIQFSLFLPILILFTGCNLPAPNYQVSRNSSLALGEEQVKVTFRVHLEQPLPPGDSIFLSILDEVTGLAINPQKHVMNAEDSVTYSASIPFNLGTVVKYRYSREGATYAEEYLFSDKPVRYRLYHVEGGITKEDTLFRWTDTDFQGTSGRITGQVTDISTGKPISNIMVATGGAQAFSASDGTFLLEGIPSGKHDLVFYSLDGAYTIYQQGAIVADNSTTPVYVQLSKAYLVNVIFTVTVPPGTPNDAPIRLAGNLYQLGNTFGDLSGGVSTLATKMPVLGKLTDGRYILAINLPAGTYIEYKYTLGDGLWSSEITNDGYLSVRHLIVPDDNIEIEDAIESWEKAESRSLNFELKVPANTPSDDRISIQFNPGFGWFEALPMWPSTNTIGEKVWKFTLTGPFNNFTLLRYRYCREEQCGVADDEATKGVDPQGREINPSINPGLVTDEVIDWAWFSSLDEPAYVPDVPVTPRGPDFVAGISIRSKYLPSWSGSLPKAAANIKNLNVNWLVISPTRTFTDSKLPILESIPSQDIPLPDLLNIIHAAEMQGLNVGIFPAARFPVQSSLWWKNSSRDYVWWTAFFENYTNFIIDYANIATETNVKKLVLGGDWVNSALPNGLLQDGSSSQVFPDAETRWRDLITKIRQQYSGSIVWTLSYPDGVKNPPPFLDAVDEIFVLWSAPIAVQPDTPFEIMYEHANNILAQDILPLHQTAGKPIIIAIAYPSIDLGSIGCIPILGGGCLDYELLSPPNTDITALTLDLQDQANAYNAVLSAINDNEWVSGFISMGYYPFAIVQDKSLSINGKPASRVLMYWAQKYLGK